MGVFSKHERFREVGERANVNNVERFGSPVRSLFTTSKVFTLHKHIDILDEAGNVAYVAETKFPSIHDKTDIINAEGEHVAHIERKLLTLHERHYITLRDGVQVEFSNEIWHIYKDITNIEGLGWQVRGNMFGLNFEVYDAEGNIIGVIGQKLLSIHDKYCIDIYNTECEEALVAILITLQHMIRDRAASGSSGGSSSGSSS